MNMWVKPGISVGCVAAACIFTAVIASGTVGGISVGAGDAEAKRVKAISEYNEVINDIGGFFSGGIASASVSSYDEEGTAGEQGLQEEVQDENAPDEEREAVTSFTLTESSNVGMSYSMKLLDSTYSMENMSTRKLQLAATETEVYFNSDLISFVKMKDSSQDYSVTMDISAEVYALRADTTSTLYINVHRFNVLMNGVSYSAPTTVLDHWCLYDATTLDENKSLSAATLLVYVLSGYSNASFIKIMDTYATQYSSEKFTMNGIEYVLKENYFRDFVSSVAGTTISDEVETNGKFSINLKSDSSPVTTLNYKFGYSETEGSLNAYGNDKVVFKNINNTVINGADMTDAMSLNEYMDYWGDGLEWIN